MFVKKGKKWRNPRTIGNEKGKNTPTILGSKSILLLFLMLKAILWHYCINIKNKDEYKETKKKEKSLKINNQWRDKIKQSDFIKENRKKLKKLIKKMVIK